jgi:GGDEF domain-containing protein
LSRASRHELPVSVVLLEIGAEKRRLSDAEVSTVAEEVTVAIKKRLRGEDQAARLGPLKFAVIGVETAESEALANSLALHVRRSMTAPPENGTSLTVTVGAIDCQYDELSAAELLREAERSLAAAILARAGVGYPTR